jgi:hypothetical protein
MIFSLLSAMLDYLVFPIIGLVLAFSTMARIHRQTGSDRVAGVVGIAGFLFCLWVPGHLLYGLVLVVVFMALAIASADSPEQS